MNYDALLQSIQQTHSNAKSAAAGAVNRQLVCRNWLIGAYLVEFEQNGEDRAAYGSQLLKRLAKDLTTRKIPGTSTDMLERMRSLYIRYPQIVETISAPSVRKLSNNHRITSETDKIALSAEVSIDSEPSPLPPLKLLQLSWTHLSELARIDDPWKRAFYENECLKGNWSKRQLQRQIGSFLYERTGLSTDKKAVIQAGRDQADAKPETLDSMIRDPYVLEFAGLTEKPHYLERDLETGLLNHLQAFLLELGSGFCFEARQKRVTVGTEHDYIDLVFYHRILRCHLLIDLKTRKFDHRDSGQMNFYLNYWKDQMMAEGDNPPVGLILCTDSDQTKVQYATSGIDHQLFVSRYLIALPKPEELEALIEDDRAVFEEQAAYNRQTSAFP